MSRRGLTAALVTAVAATALTVGPGPAGAAPTWLEDVQLSPGTWANSANVLVDGDGDLAVVWGDGNPAQVTAAERRTGGSWTTKTPLANQAGTFPSTAVMDPAGFVTAVWSADGLEPGTSYSLYSARRSPAGQWSPVEQLTPGPDDSGVPSVGVDDAGNVSVVWRSNVGNAPVQYLRRTATGAWEAPITVSGPGGLDPVVAVTGSGRLVVGWHQSAPQEGLHFRERQTDGTWGEPQFRAAEGANQVSAALANDGTLDFAWVQLGPEGFDNHVVAAHRPAGGALGASQPLFPATSSFLDSLQVVADGVGGAVGTFRFLGAKAIYREAGSTTWTAPVAVPLGADAADLAVGPGGVVTMAAKASDSGGLVTVSTKPPGGAWTSPVVIANATTYVGTPPSVVVDNQGNTTVSWENFEENGPPETRLHVRTLDAAGPESSLGTGGLLSPKKKFGLSWSAYDRWSSVLNHDVRLRTATWKKKSNLSAYDAWRTATTVTSGSFKGKLGRTYCFSSRATDTIANQGPWTADTCVVMPLDDRSLAAAGGWVKGKGKAYLGKTYLQTSKQGASLSLGRVKARTIGLLADRLPKGGKVVIRIGKKKVGSVSLKGKAQRSQAILVKQLGKPKAGTLTITVVSGGKPVRIDGVFLGK